MPIKQLLAILLLFISTTIISQEKFAPVQGGKILGSVMDSASHQPVEYATISLHLGGSKKAINGGTTDKKGNYIIDNVDLGTYSLLVESIGFKPLTINNVEVYKSKGVINLKVISLIPKSNTLQTVTVTAQAKFIENRIDKMVFNAEKDITSQTGVATDILKKLPQVSVGIDGNVELAGSSSIRFLINGKPSSAFGNNITDVLQAIPANQIKSIEVITNPGAKYDAQGIGGIINIILKKNNAQGINGNLSLSAGTRNENASFNFNVRRGAFGMHAFVSGNARLRATSTSQSDRETLDTADKTKVSFLQYGQSSGTRHGFQTGMGFDWTYKEKNSFSGGVSYNQFGSNGLGFNNQLQNIFANGGNGSVISNINTLNNIDNAFKAHNVDANLYYKRTFAKADEELEIALNSSHGNSVNTANNLQYALPYDVLNYARHSRNPGHQNENELRIDYGVPLKKNVIFGSGSKISFVDITSNSNVNKLLSSTHNVVADPFLTNSLNYHQKVYALYAELSFPVFKLFDAKLGERYERTEIEAFYSNAQVQKDIPGYNSLVPSVYLMKKLGENGGNLKLSFSKRIGRPDYGDLNPFINTSDPKNISTGNSNLQPEKSYRYELAYNKDLGKSGSFMVNLFYRKNENDIQPFVVYYPSFQVGDSVFTNVAVSTRQNIGTENNTGINIFDDFRVNTKFSVRTNISMFHRKIINAIDKGYDVTSFNYRLNMNGSYQFSSTLAAEFFGNFSSPRNEAQGKYPSFTSYSFAIRKQFWNKNGSLALTATNPFKETISQRTELFGPNFVVNNVRNIPFRSIGINFTYKFGRLEFKKDHNNEGENGGAGEP